MPVKYIKNNNDEFKIEFNPINYRNLNTCIFTMGGVYDECINITIKTDNKRRVGYISYIKYEPECSLTAALERGGGIVEMVKLALQFVNKIYPEITTFELRDTSNIECDNIDMTTSPPRKVNKPLSLSNLYILLYGKTWYELHFNAEMVDKEIYNIYKNSTQIFGLTIKNPIDTIATYINDTDKLTQLQQYYDANKTWHDFFNKIPRKRRCELLYNWIPNFVRIHIGELHQHNMWEIDINRMTKTYMEIIDAPTAKQITQIGGNNKITITNILDRHRSRKTKFTLQCNFFQKR